MSTTLELQGKRHVRARDGVGWLCIVGNVQTGAQQLAYAHAGSQLRLRLICARHFMHVGTSLDLS